MTMSAIFDLSPALQLVAFLVLAATGWLLGFGALRALERRYRMNQRLLPVGPTIATVTTVFALFVGFLAGDIWDQKQQATSAAYDERSSLAQLLDLAGPHGLQAAALHGAALRYHRSVVEDEWGTGRNRSQSTETEAALADLRAEVVRLAANDTRSTLVAQLFRDLDALADARDTRLAIGADHDGDNAWFTVVVLYLLSFVAIAVAHLDRPPAGMLAMTVFAVATSLGLWFLALHDNPYGGGVVLDSRVLALGPPG